MAVNGKLQQS